MTDPAWVPGDLLGLQIPADSVALRARAESFLTEAFRASGVLAADNWVTKITRFEECLVGGTGRKLILSVAYEKPASGLQTDLFVKFSRNFEDPFRDRNRHMLESEVWFANLSRLPGFPIAVPACVFADFHHASGTGLLITERVAFGTGRIEPHYTKCLDHEMPNSVEHYKALMRSLARLSGAHKGGRLAKGFDERFPFNADQVIAGDRIRYDDAQMQRRAERVAAFIATYPHLFPTNLTSPDFLGRIVREIPSVARQELAIKAYLHSKPAFIALCHWNANIDNAWFWRGDDGVLACGLIDWQRVGQMNVAQAIYGAFSGASPAVWNAHFDEMLAVFAAEYHQSGGPTLDVSELKLHVQLTTAMMGLAYMMDAPAILAKQIPDLGSLTGPYDPRVTANEDALVPFHFITMLLNQWETQKVGELVEKLLRRA